MREWSRPVTGPVGADIERHNVKGGSKRECLLWYCYFDLNLVRRLTSHGCENQPADPPHSVDELGCCLFRRGKGIGHEWFDPGEYDDAQRVYIRG
jgi:hypothetical protein